MNPAASPNGDPFANHAFHMHQQPQMLPQNQPQQFHGSPWQQPHPLHLPSTSNPVSQMQSQPYPNPPQYYQNHASLPFDLPSFPQQIVQDFLRLSTPVGSSHNDDTVLAQALYDSKQTGRTYRHALEGLHGVNNHAANLWKDYYLDHHDRIDLLVSRLADQPKTVKKPFVLSSPPPHPREQGRSPQVARKRHISPPLPSPPSQLPKNKGHSSVPSQTSRRKRVTPPTAATTSVLTRPPKRPRATVNSLSAPLPCNDVPNLMPPQVHIPLPDPPSRSPTPPAVVHVGTNGNKYTKQDREYFIKFLAWRLKEDPSLTKKELCELLYEKAPHHSVSSWASHWHQRHDIADKIFAAYHAKSDADGEYDEDDLNEKEEVEVEVEMQDDEDDEASTTEAPRYHRVMRRSRAPFSVLEDTNVDTEDDEADMGEPGAAFTRGDWCILARFIARNEWDEMLRKKKWQTFTETYGNRTKRTAKAWAEFFRKNEAAVLKLAKRYTPESRGNNKSRRVHSLRRNRQDTLQEPDVDEDGEYEIENEED